MTSNRIDFVDVTRAYAIALVTFGHAMGEFGAWELLDEQVRDVARLVTRTGTPLFILMFGMMIELVHVRRAEQDGVASLRPRLHRRALECWLGYLACSFAAIVGHRGDLGDTAEAAFLLGGAGYGTILALYALALLITPGLIRLRLRHGPWAAPLLIAGIWAVDGFLLTPFDGRDAGIWAYPIDFLVGAGRHIRGPSVLHALTFVLAGMVLAHGLRVWREDGARRFHQNAAVVAGLSGLVVAWLVFRDGWDAVLDGWRFYRGFRRDNDLGYFAIGILGATATLAFASIVVPRRGLPRWTAWPLQLGRSSLLAFAGGSIGLTVLDLDQRRALGHHGLVAAALYVALVVAFVNWRRILGRMRSQGTSTALPTRRWSSRSERAAATASSR